MRTPLFTEVELRDFLSRGADSFREFESTRNRGDARSRQFSPSAGRDTMAESVPAFVDADDDRLLIGVEKDAPPTGLDHAKTVIAEEIVEQVRRAATQRLLFLPHAVRQMAHPDRMITPSEIRAVIEQGTIIEDYPEDVRGHSCLLHGRGNKGRDIHVVCSPKEDFLAIITAYLPSQKEWERDMSTRRTS